MKIVPKEYRFDTYSIFGNFSLMIELLQNLIRNMSSYLFRKLILFCKVSKFLYRYIKWPILLDNMCLVKNLDLRLRHSMRSVYLFLPAQCLYMVFNQHK